IGDVKRIANPNRMTDDDIALQFFHLLRWDDTVFECAKTRRDTVGNGSLVYEAADGIGRTGNFPECLVAQLDVRIAGFAVGDGDDLLNCETGAVNHDGINHSYTT